MVNNPDVPQIVQTGALVPLSNLSVDTSRYLPSVLTAGQYDGKLYGLAPNVNTLALFYNKTLLKQAGVSVPTTWAELSAAAKKLTKGDTHGFAYSAASGTEGSRPLAQAQPVAFDRSLRRRCRQTASEALRRRMWREDRTIGR